eukprot:SAG31_NODE_8815_length_1382_cov_1.844115_1_plen_400_part_10
MNWDVHANRNERGSNPTSAAAVQSLPAPSGALRGFGGEKSQIENASPSSRPEQMAAMEAELLRLRARRRSRKNPGLIRLELLDAPFGQQETVHGAAAAHHWRQTYTGGETGESLSDATSSVTADELATMRRENTVRNKAVQLQAEIVALRNKQHVRKLAWRAGGEAIMAQRGCPVRSRNAATRHITATVRNATVEQQPDEQAKIFDQATTGTATCKAVDQLSRLLIEADIDAAAVLDRLSTDSDGIASRVDQRAAVASLLSGHTQHRAPPPIPATIDRPPVVRAPSLLPAVRAQAAAQAKSQAPLSSITSSYKAGEGLTGHHNNGLRPTTHSKLTTKLQQLRLQQQHQQQKNISQPSAPAAGGSPPSGPPPPPSAAPPLPPSAQTSEAPPSAPPAAGAAQ